jgi:hypothetical protein
LDCRDYPGGIDDRNVEDEVKQKRESDQSQLAVAGKIVIGQ